MARSKKALKITFEDFDGIDLRKTHTGKISCADIENFRIMPDGSLKKRCGYKPIYTSASKVYAVWSGMLGGEFVCFAVIGSNVYKIDLENNTAKSIAFMSSGSSRFSFFFYIDTLYLKDTTTFYKVTTSYVKKVEGYVPLYGKDWPTTFCGEINEPLNLLNTKARISYKVPANNSVMLPTGLKVLQVYSVYKNGELLPSSSYTIDSTFNTINMQSVKEGDEFLVNLQFDYAAAGTSTMKMYLFQTTGVKVYSDIHTSRVFLWGSTPKNTVYATTPISAESYAESEKYFSGHSPIYVPVGSEFVLGDGKNNVTAMLTHYDRLLIFTDGDVWMVDSAIFSDQNTPVKSINSVAGSSVSGAAIMAGNDPVSVGRHTIFRWTSDTDEFNQCNAYSISDGINEKLSADFFKNAIVFNDIYKNELWFYDPSGDGTVWIYSVNKKHWFKYTGIVAKSFFDANGKVGFYDDYSIYVFSEELAYDTDNSGAEKEITAVFESGLLDFESHEKKRLLEICTAGDVKSGELQVELRLDTGEVITSHPTVNGAHTLASKKLTSGRFSSLKMFIRSSGQTDGTIHSVILKANKKTR